MTIWTFGDSFIRHTKISKYFAHLEDAWVENIKRRLNQTLVSNAKPLFTLEHVYDNFYKHRNEYQTNDIIIVTLTNIERRWYWRNYPLQILQMTNEEKEATEMHHELLNQDVYQTYILNFLHNLNYISKKHNLHTIVLPSYLETEEIVKPITQDFNAIHFSNICLNTVSFKEFKTNPWEMGITEDLRLNHLCRSNHIILADKIVDNITNKTPINLSTNFEEGFIDDKLFTNNDFIRDQLFGGLINRIQKIKLKVR